jgi:radical SAM superfamily enzyme YgiQ (UPF0313 family)
MAVSQANHPPENRKVLLIRPAPASEQFGDESFQPLGLGYIAAVLEKAGCRVKILDLLIEKKSDEEVLAVAESFKPRWAGFTAVTPVVKGAYRLGSRIKGKFPRILTFLGGPHATALPEEPLANGMDVVIRGEGEETVLELVNAPGGWDGIPGLSFLKDGKPFRTPDREFIRDLDLIPFPARHLFPPIERYGGQEALGNLTPVGSLLSSRGCPYTCQFCFKAVFGNKFRPRSAESVLEEWIHLKEKYRVREIAIVDDSFTSDPDRVHRICDTLIRYKAGIRWSCPNGIRVDRADPEMLAKMRRAGCYRVALGIESGNQAVLDSIGKKITLEKIRETVANCRKAGIKTMGFFMLGNLGETRETMEQTVEFAVQLGTDYAQFLIAIPYPGTRLYDEIVKSGKLYITDWDQYGQYEGSACFEHGSLTPGLLSEMHQWAARRYYWNPAYLIRQAVNLETYLFLPRRIRAAMRLLRKGWDVNRPPRRHEVTKSGTSLHKDV